MDGILEANFLTQLGPVGIAVIALICCYFIYQAVVTNRTDAIDGLDQIRAEMEKMRTETTAALGTLTQQNIAFQIEIASTRPTRQEMTENIDRLKGVFSDLMLPIREDLSWLKNALLTKGRKDD
jgi:flagellar biosynthesis/type III secretory pathway M-ring protein FliF/YscJ